MTFLQTSAPRKPLIPAYLPPGNGGVPPGRRGGKKENRTPCGDTVENRHGAGRGIRPDQLQKSDVGRYVFDHPRPLGLVRNALEDREMAKHVYADILYHWFRSVKDPGPRTRVTLC